MADKNWMLIKASEGGNPITFLTPDDLDRLLTNPEEWGVTSFVEPRTLYPDPAYWSDGVAALVRYEVVTPIPAGAYKLPPGLDE